MPSPGPGSPNASSFSLEKGAFLSLCGNLELQCYQSIRPQPALFPNTTEDSARAYTHAEADIPGPEKKPPLGRKLIFGHTVWVAILGVAVGLPLTLTPIRTPRP